MAVVACGVAALVNADKPFVFQLFDLLTLAILIAIAYGAWITQEEQRAYRVGFLCWAVLYYWFFKGGFNIGTDELMDFAASINQPDRLSADDFFAEPVQAPPPSYGYNWYAAFRSIGHSLFLLFFGLIGGWVTVFFYRKRERMLAK